MEKIELKNLAMFAKSVISQLKPHNDRAAILALVGDLGAGKTTFVQALAKELGVEQTVQSPTYVLMKTYAISHPQFTQLIHIDAYRLGSAEEFRALKPESFLKNPKALICIEWPERVGGALPKPDVVLKFSSDGVSSHERYITRDE